MQEDTGAAFLNFYTMKSPKGAKKKNVEITHHRIMEKKEHIVSIRKKQSSI